MQAEICAKSAFLRKELDELRDLWDNRDAAVFFCRGTTILLSLTEDCNMHLEMMLPVLLAAEENGGLAKKMVDMMGGLPPMLIVFLISMIPILELRGGLVAAAILKIPMWKAIGVCALGNIIPIPFILLFIEKILIWMEHCRIGWMNKLALWLKERALGEKSQKIRKYEFVGLLLFVGIPLPGTGAWTGSLIASMLHVERKKAVPAIFLGLILATVIMCIITYLIPALVKAF